MKKWFAVFLMVLSLFSAAKADQDSYSVEGEWYAFVLYENGGRETLEDSDGNFIVEYADEKAFFGTDGTMKTENEEYSPEFIQLSDNAYLYYNVQDDKLYGYFFLRRADSFRFYEISAPAILLMDGEMIKRNSGKISDYLYKSNGSLFVEDDNSYTRGTVVFENENLFFYDMLEEPVIQEYGDVTVNLGVLFMGFISTSVVK